MSVTTRQLAVTLLAVVLGGAARAQGLPPEVQRPSGPEFPVSPPAVDGKAAAEAPPPAGSAGPDDWITYRRPQSCFCPLGGDGPIQTELYLRVGPDFPVGGGIYSRMMQTGWEIQGGGRALFFVPDRTAAWVVDLGIVNVWNHTNRPDIPIFLNEPVTTTSPLGLSTTSFQPVTVTADALNRTMGSASIGKEWWLTDPATAAHNRVRWGIDVGGRYGSDDATFHEIRHRTDTIGGFFVAVHADLEIPCGCCTFLAGLRTEYEYTSSDVLQSQQSGDVADIALLLNFGVRF
jgi:hypothetical protein